MHQHLSPPTSNTSHKSRKLRVTYGEHSDTLDTDILLKAINNSFTKQMSGNTTTLDASTLLTFLTQFSLKSLISQSIIKNGQFDKYFIVEIDESLLTNKGIGSIGANSGFSFFSCQSVGHRQQKTSRALTSDIPYTVPYCLTFQMNERQLHFQSQLIPENRFYINLDTVTVKLKQQQITNNVTVNKIYHKSLLNYPIELVIENKQITVHIYITQSLLPFPFSESENEKNKMHYLIDTRRKLYNLLKKCIQNSRGSELQLKRMSEISLINQRPYLNDRFVTEQQLVNGCQSGDIIMFRDKHFMAKVQRVITHSPVDHIAIVFKSPSLGLCLFESSSGMGVGLTLWRKLVRGHWYRGIDKIYWRKLQVHKKPINFDSKFEEFVRGNLNKQFEISIPKLLKFKAITYSKEDNHSYFCSELAAELYRYLGLLDETKSSSQYWPKDFVQGKGIEILNGALDPEREIVFDQTLLKVTYPGFKSD